MSIRCCNLLRSCLIACGALLARFSFCPDAYFFRCYPVSRSMDLLWIHPIPLGFLPGHLIVLIRFHNPLVYVLLHLALAVEYGLFEFLRGYAPLLVQRNSHCSCRRSFFGGACLVVLQLLDLVSVLSRPRVFVISSLFWLGLYPPL